MTEKQIERVKTKIKKIKAALAADKKFWRGYYHDGSGLRYDPPRLYIQISDFTGGLRYMNWFHKNFPDDSCYPEFLFEWTIILFKRGKLKEAEKKAFQTFCNNTYIFDKFFDIEIIPIDKSEDYLGSADLMKKSFEYSHTDESLADFSEWLSNFIKTEKFIQHSNKLIETNKRLKNEDDTEVRGYLVNLARQLEEEF